MPEDKEKPAKIWQVESLEKQITLLRKSVDSVSDKQELMLERQVTAQFVEDRVSVVDRKVDNEVKLMREKYDPYVENAKWLTRGVIMAVVGQAIMITFQLLGGG